MSQSVSQSASLCFCFVTFQTLLLNHTCNFHSSSLSSIFLSNIHILPSVLAILNDTPNVFDMSRVTEKNDRFVNVSATFTTSEASLNHTHQQAFIQVSVVSQISKFWQL